MSNGEGSGWHDDPYEHDLARQGIKTKQPGITEEDAEKIVTAIKKESPTHTSQAKSQMTWYEELWLKGEMVQSNKMDELSIEDLQKIRKVAEENRDKAKNAGNDHHAYFYERQRDAIKEKIGDKLNLEMKNMEKQKQELSGW